MAAPHSKPHHYSIGKICFEKIFDRYKIFKCLPKKRAQKVVKAYPDTTSCNRISLSEKSKGKNNQGLSHIAQQRYYNPEIKQSGAP